MAFRKRGLLTLLCCSMLLCSCSGGSTDSSPLTPDQIFSGGSKNNDTAVMMDISSQRLVSNIRIGWNLGNTLECCISDLDGNGITDVMPVDGDAVSETLWGNPMATEKLFKALVDSGVNAVRLPVTWRDHIDRTGKIEESWLNRVTQVAEYAYDCGMYVILTMYHDGAADTDHGAWIRTAATDFEAAAAQYESLWRQISEHFSQYNERILFESMNEVGFGTLPRNEAMTTLNRLNQIFVDTVRSTGGNNPERHLIIAGYMADIEQTCTENFAMPDDPAERCIVSVHYYYPKTFCQLGIVNQWGSEAEQNWMEENIALLESTFVDNGIPVIITEYGTSGSDLPSRIFFCEKLTKLCRDAGIATFLWDGGEWLDRTSYSWSSSELIRALTRASSGIDYTPEKITAD